MNKMTAISIENIIRHFLDNQPVNKIIRMAFNRAEQSFETVELVKGLVFFQYHKNIDSKTLCEVRVHSGQLISLIQQTISPKEKFETDTFSFIRNDENIKVEVSYDTSGWYTITSLKLDAVAALAIERSKE